MAQLLWHLLKVPAAAAAVLLLLFLGALRRPPTRVLHSAAAGGGVALDVESAVQLHGLVEKQGALAYVHRADVLPSTATLKTHMYPQEWADRRLLGERGVPPPVAVCPLVVNHEYKVIYMKATKAAGTSVMAFFSTCTDINPEPYCLTYEDAYNATQRAHLQEVWPDYFVFTFMRNPLARAISQYQYLTHMMRPECLVPWGSFCSDPYILGDECHRNSSCCDQPARHHYLHVEPQATCLLTEDGGLAADFVGRVEAFDQDFAELLRLLNARPGVPQLPEALPSKRNFNESPCDDGKNSSSRVQGQQQQQQQQGVVGGQQGGAGAEAKPQAGAAGEAAAAAGEQATAAAAGAAAAATGAAAAAGPKQKPRAAAAGKRPAAGGKGKGKPRGLFWTVQDGIFNPCDKRDYFQGEYAHCLADTAAFFADDFSALM